MIPRLYAIADAGILAARGICAVEFAEEIAAAGVELIQYRDKAGSPQQVLETAAQLRSVLSRTTCRLILNDRADLAFLVGAGGVHVGQDDLDAADARALMGANALIGVSTHTDDQVAAAEAGCADYVAIGPVFPTGSKLNHDPVIGLEGLRRARQLTSKPLVAIGGITRGNARGVMEAGADSVAVLSALLPHGESIAQVTRDFIDILR